MSPNPVSSPGLPLPPHRQDLFRLPSSKRAKVKLTIRRVHFLCHKVEYPAERTAHAQENIDALQHSQPLPQPLSDHESLRHA